MLFSMLLDKFPTFLHGHDYLPCSPQCCRVSLLPFFMDMTPSPTLSSMMLGKSPTFLHGHDCLPCSPQCCHDSLPCSSQCCWISSLPFFMDMTPFPTLSTMLLGKSPTFLHGHDSLPCSSQCCRVSPLPFFMDTTPSHALLNVAG